MFGAMEAKRRTHSKTNHFRGKWFYRNKIHCNDGHCVVINSKLPMCIDRRIHESQPVGFTFFHFHVERRPSSICTVSIDILAIDESI